jgi:uncharacterized membrane protein
MEKMIQALFDSESAAFKGLKAIQDLKITQDISLGETYILSKDTDGNIAIRSAKDDADGYSAIGGGIIGGLIGLLAGPLGFLVGIGAGMVAGAAGDTVRAEGVSDYLDQIGENIPEGKSVLVAHVWEDWEVPVNTALEPFTTDVYRMNIDEHVFVPAKTGLDKLNGEITNAETAYLAANDDDEKAIWNEKLLLLKIKREQLLEKLNENTVHQEKQYEQWVDNHHQHNADKGHIEKVLHDKEKHDRLESRIAEQKTRLEDLRKNR